MSQNIITRQGSCRLLNYYSELLNEPFTASLKRFTFFCLHSHLLITVLLNVTSVRGFWDFTCSWLHAQLIANKLSWPFEFSPAFFIHCSPSRCLTTSRWTQRFLTFSCSVFMFASHWDCLCGPFCPGAVPYAAYIRYPFPFFKGVSSKQICQIVQILTFKLSNLQISVPIELSFPFSSC